MNIVSFVRHHLKDVKKGWFNLDEVRGVKWCDEMFCCVLPATSSVYFEMWYLHTGRLNGWGRNDVEHQAGSHRRGRYVGQR